MERVFLILTVAVGGAGGMAVLWGYLLSLKGRKVPKGWSVLQFVLFCGFFVCWFLWNLFRQFP